MAAFARALSRASGTEIEVETLKSVIMFCGVGFTVSMMLASYGVDLAPGFF
jgi:Na+/H+ antiporter NhaA